MRVAVIGAGVSGLTAALELASRGIPVTVFNPPAKGSSVATRDFAGGRVELGPDSYLRRPGPALSLIESMGLPEIYPATTRASMMTARGPIPLPRGLTLGAPRTFSAAMGNPMMGLGSKLRAGVGALLLGSSTTGDDLGQIADSRYGRRWARLNIEPLVGGINADSIYGLSARVSAPAIADIAKLNAPPTSLGGPAFAAPESGLSALVERMTERLLGEGAELSEQACEGLSVHPGSVSVETGKEELGFDHVVVAVPAYVASHLLREAAPHASLLLGTIDYSSVSMLIGSASAALPGFARELSGILIDRELRLLSTAVSIYSNKWPTRVPEGTAVFRISTGSLIDRRHLEMTDGDLIEALWHEANRVLGTDLDLEQSLVVRWNRALPHFAPYHPRLIDHARRSTASATGGRVSLAGAYISGSGIPTCIAVAMEAAAGCVERASRI